MAVIERQPDNPLTVGAGFPPPNSQSEPVGLSGDNWYSVADRINKKAGLELSAQDLIYHNFKLKPTEPYFAAKVNYYLRTLVGCTVTDGDGKNGNNYVFKGATRGLIYYPVLTPPTPPAEPGRHVIIIGGIAVNDKAENPHDRNPYNFINPGVRRAKAFKSDAQVIFFAPSYEVRVRDQEKEDPRVHMTYVLDSCDPDSLWHRWHREKNPDHFLNTVRTAASVHKFKLTTIRSAAQLTAELNKIDRIASIHYYGHSNDQSLLLNYAIDGNPTASEVWSDKKAVALPASKFTSSAVFVSCGCFQGEEGGLADDLRRLWGIRAIGAKGRTEYAATGDGRTMFPAAPKGYFEYRPKMPGEADFPDPVRTEPE